MGGSGGFRFLWLLGGELEEDELDELEVYWAGKGVSILTVRGHEMAEAGLLSVSYYLVRADNWKGDCGRDWAMEDERAMG